MIQEKGCSGFLRHVMDDNSHFLSSFIKHLLAKTVI